MATIEEIKNIPIIEYAQSLGYTVKKTGNTYTLKEHDSIRIDVEKNFFFQNSTGKAGSIIDFSMHFENKDLQTTLKDLGDMLKTNTYHFKEVKKEFKTKEKEPVKFTLPEQAQTTQNVYAYLTNTRKIDKDIVNDMIKNGNLYQDTHRNCVFVSHDKQGKAIFGNIRGTNTGKRFVADIKGNDYKHCFYVDNGTNAMIVSESVIDNLSIMTEIKSRGKEHKRFNYLALSGASKITAVETHIKESPKIKTVIIALDNDEAGRTNAAKIHKALEPYPDVNVIDKFPTNAKDWNEQLILTVEERNKTIEKKPVSQETEV